MRKIDITRFLRNRFNRISFKNRETVSAILTFIFGIVFLSYLIGFAYLSILLRWSGLIILLISYYLVSTFVSYREDSMKEVIDSLLDEIQDEEANRYIDLAKKEEMLNKLLEYSYNNSRFYENDFDKKVMQIFRDYIEMVVLPLFSLRNDMIDGRINNLFINVSKALVNNSYFNIYNSLEEFNKELISKKEVKEFLFLFYGIGKKEIEEGIIEIIEQINKSKVKKWTSFKNWLLNKIPFKLIISLVVIFLFLLLLDKWGLTNKFLEMIKAIPKFN